MGALRQSITKLIRWSVYCSGLCLLAKYINRDRIRILAYHAVVADSYKGDWTPLRMPHDLGRLEQTLRFLSRRYNFISLDKAVDIVSGNAPPVKNAAVLVFDDGYRNQFTYAVPVLRELGIPAAFYVVTQYVSDRTVFWFDRLDFALQAGDCHGTTWNVAGRTVEIRSRSRQELDDSFRELRSAAKDAVRDDNEMLEELGRVSAELEARSGRKLSDIFERDDWSALATWEELRAADADPLLSIESHTRQHARIGLRSPEEATLELVGSKEDLERELGRDCRHFCYPSGSYNDETPGLVRQAGYRSGLTSEPGLNGIGDNPYLLKRIELPDTADRARISLAVSGFSSLMGG